MKDVYLLETVLDSVVKDLILCVDDSSPCIEHRAVDNTDDGATPSHQDGYCFLNKSLRMFIGCESMSIQNIKIRNLEVHNDKYFADCSIRNLFGEIIGFNAQGVKVNKQKMYVFSLQHNGNITCDGTESIADLFDKSKIVLGIIELDNDGGWRNVLMNNYANACKLVERGTENDPDANQNIYDCCSKSRHTGRLETIDFGRPYPFVRLHISYIGKSKCTLLPRFAYFGLDSTEERETLTSDLENFFIKAPVMMGMVDIVDSKSRRMVCVNDRSKKFIRTLNEALVDDETMQNYYDMFFSLFQKTLDSKDPVVTEVSFPLPDGSEGSYLGVFSCLSKSPTKSRHAYILNDITGQRKAEAQLAQYRDTLEHMVRQRTAELQESEERFRSLVASAPSIILTLNPQGIVIFANREFKCGQTVVGTTIDKLITEGPEFLEKLQRTFTTGRPFKKEVKLVIKDVWLNVHVGRVNEKLAILVANDITEMKQLSEELRRAITTKSRFLANMSHEIRTPLSGIIGMSRMLSDTDLTMDQADCVSTIQQCGETLLSLINDVLDYTKLEATGEMELIKENFSLQQVLEESLYTVLPAADKKGIELILDVSPGSPDWVVGDSMRLRQILVNLLNNSVKFTDHGYILLSIFAEESDSSNVFHIKVKDTGCGVKPDSQGKLFQMFSQVDNSSTRRFGGTGIGLALARRFAEMMGGKIWMESTGKEGDGSTFTFTLPAVCAHCPPPAGYLTPFASALLSKKTAVVVVDKSEISRLALKRRLENMGFPWVSAAPRISEIDVRKHSADQVLIFLDTDTGCPDLQKVLSPSTALIFMGNKCPHLENSISKFTPSIFDFARKPLKDAAICRCINSISLQLHHFAAIALNNLNNVANHISNNFSNFSSNSRLSPRMTKSCTKQRTNSFTVYPLQILVVEDNEVNQRVIKRLLAHIGYSSISLASNGQEALDLMNYKSFDIIFMDVQMPVLDGVECTRIIRRKYGQSIYIVSMTADAFPEDRQNCLSAGMNDFLTKPIRLEQLQTALESCFTSPKNCI